MKNTNKISSDRQRVFYILCILFYIYPLSAQRISVQNKSNTSSLHVITDSQKITIKKNEKKDFTNLKTLLLSNDSGLTQTLYLFLDPKETLNIQISDTKINYKGNKDSLQSYIEMLNAVTFGELKNYYKYYYQEKNPKKYINSSEMLYADISKKTNALNTPLSSEETTQRLKTYIKYNWLSTVFLGFQGKNIDTFQKEIVPYYYNKYISNDIPKFQCESVYQYDILKYLAKYKKELGIQLPVYEIVATDDNDYINQHLPKSCQRYYFQNNYKYRNHINDPKQEYYKNILVNQFNISTL